MYWLYRAVELFSVGYTTLNSLKILRELRLKPRDSHAEDEDEEPDSHAVAEADADKDTYTVSPMRMRLSPASSRAKKGKKGSNTTRSLWAETETRARETLMFWAMYGV